MAIATIGVYACLFLGLYFEVFLLISFFEKKPDQKSSKRPTYYPSVTILVPCWNKAKTLGGTVESLLKLDYPKEKLSIVVIDDGSTDGTFEAAQKYAHYPQVKIFQKQNEGSKYSALNFGLAHSQSELVGCLDADSFVVSDALLEVVKKFESNPEVMAATPAMKVFKPRSVLELMQAVEYTFGIFYRKMFDNLAAISVIPGPFSIYRRELFDKIGNFRRAHHTEDMEMAFRMHENNFAIANVHTAIVYTTVPKTLGSLLRQRTRWSQGFLGNVRDYKHMIFNPRYGNFGMLTIPFGLAAFCAGIYTGAYAAYSTLHAVFTRVYDAYATGIPMQLPTPSKFEWFYINTHMTTFLILTVFCLTLVAIFIGKRISDAEITLKSLVSYFAFFGFVAPLWLARASYNAIMDKETGWLT
jgi:cellulose synthase/poly-beta-1,6-N-acetylglucosamine synthase-like glycosyltransferase